MDMNDRLEYYQTAGRESAPLSEILYPSERKKLNDLGISNEEIDSWSIRAVHDTNAKNGFYACVIETGDNEAAVAFRGSESFSLKNLDQDFYDWIQSDLGLLNSRQTPQQAEVDRFLEENKELLSEYDSLMMTGHSLGGNLAEYATIVSDQYGLDDNITQCSSLDGPSFSNEFIQEHSDQIQKLRMRKENGDIEMVHYRWSLVGGLLQDLDCVDYHYAEVSNDENNLDTKKYTFLTRHDTKFLAFNGDSFKIDDGPDSAAEFARELSNEIEDPKNLTVMINQVGSRKKFTENVGIVAPLLTIGMLSRVFPSFLEHYSNRNKIAAAKEAEKSTDFYIDPSSFLNLSEESVSISEQLSDIKDILERKPYRFQINMPYLPENAKDTLVRDILAMINGLIDMFDKMLYETAYGANLVKESLNTMEAVTAYLESTGTDFQTTENLAVGLMNEWNP